MVGLRGVVGCGLLLLSALLAGCGGSPQAPPPGPDWALAIHGGAGTIPRDVDPAERDAHLVGLRKALAAGKTVLESGGDSLGAVEAVIVTLEDDPLFNAGRGAVYTADGRHELDAAVMRGEDLACGAVAAVSTVRHPIRLARGVMEHTRHVLLVGQGAELLAGEIGLERVEPSFFDTERRRKSLESFLEREGKRKEHGTVGAVALDMAGHLAAGTSTGGLTGKRFGRVGDVPIIGAGTFADDRTCAISCTGVGEEFIRHGIARSVSSLMSLGGLKLEQATAKAIHQTLREGEGGLIAVSARGEISMEFNTVGMFRGAADAQGRFEVKIWE